MLLKDIMTRDVITVPSRTSLIEAKKIMKEHKFRRLPVMNNGKLLGIVTEDRLEKVSPAAGTPLLWQINYLVSHTTVADVMEKNVVTIDPEATVEQGVALAQSKKVGALLVIDKSEKLVGIVTTNDFFYNILNPVLGIGVTGSRIIVPGGGEGKSAQKIISSVNKLGVEIKILWTINSASKTKDLILHLDTEDPTAVIAELQKKDFPAQVRQR